MEKISNLKQLRILDTSNIKPEEQWEASRNLSGFFSLLYKIDQRLKKERNIQNENIQRTTK
ncbi:MAG: hypothetical protein Q7K35_02175 [bacterium]|nr:hypothetical protein [bacterium]